MNPIQRKPPAKRLYRPGLGGVGVIDPALDESNKDAEKAREENLALANAEVQIELQLAGVIGAMTNAQRQALLRKRRAQAKLNAKLAVHRSVNEKQTAAAIEAATEAAFETALKELNENRNGLNPEEHAEAKSALIEVFYPTQTSDKLPSVSQGSSMTDAPRELGRLITGGYNSKKLDEVQGASRRDHASGREGDGIEPWYGEGKSGRKRADGNSVDKDPQTGPQKKEFDVKLGEAEDYKLTKKQQALEKLIGKHKVLLESLHKEEDRTRWRSNDPEARRRAAAEDTRLKLNFLQRAAAGLVPAEIAERVVPLIERDLNVVMD
jgi:hypothetical protein